MTLKAAWLHRPGHPSHHFSPEATKTQPQKMPPPPPKERSVSSISTFSPNSETPPLLIATYTIQKLCTRSRRTRRLSVSQFSKPRTASRCTLTTSQSISRCVSRSRRASSRVSTLASGSISRSTRSRSRSSVVTTLLTKILKSSGKKVLTRNLNKKQKKRKRKEFAPSVNGYLSKPNVMH